MTVSEDLEFAHQLADAADAISVRLFTDPDIGHEKKSDGTPVTLADRQVEATLRNLVAEHRQGEGFLGEESGRSGPQQRRWIVDAIDGTASFIAGDLGWGTLIALEDNGVVTVGVASSPPLGKRWWANTGAGAWEGSLPPSSPSHPERLIVSTQSSAATAQVRVWPPPDQLPSQWRACVAALVEVFPAEPSLPKSLQRSGIHQSTTSKRPGFTNGALLVASGVLDASVFFGGGPWDVAARAIICQEAGGRYTDLWGGSRLDTQTAIVTNGLIHDQLLAALSKTRPEAPIPPDLDR